MARGAVVREIACHMVRISCSAKICAMALVTAIIDKLIVTGSMTRLAGDRQVFAGEREMGRVMIERRWRPCCRVMARGAIVRKISLHMIRGYHTGKIRRMALITICIVDRIVSAHMAGDTLYGNVAAGQRECRR